MSFAPGGSGRGGAAAAAAAAPPAIAPPAAAAAAAGSTTASGAQGSKKPCAARQYSVVKLSAGQMAAHAQCRVSLYTNGNAQREPLMVRLAVTLAGGGANTVVLAFGAALHSSQITESGASVGKGTTGQASNPAIHTQFVARRPSCRKLGRQVRPLRVMRSTGAQGSRSPSKVVHLQKTGERNDVTGQIHISQTDFVQFVARRPS